MALDVCIDNSVPGSIGDTFPPTRDDEREEAKGTGSNFRQYEEVDVEAVYRTLTPSSSCTDRVLRK